MCFYVGFRYGGEISRFYVTREQMRRWQKDFMLKKNNNNNNKQNNHMYYNIEL